MNTTTVSNYDTPPAIHAEQRTPPMRRFFGVVTRSRSYKNIGYLLLGLPLGTLWFSMLISLVSLGVSMLVVALLGIPILVGFWYVVRVFANVERGAANVLLDQELAYAPMPSTARGNLWVRLRSMSSERDRWRELGYLMLRFPAGVATFTAAVTALAAPFIIGYAPVQARTEDHPFGDWFLSDKLEEIAHSPWAWFLVPLGLVMGFISFHLMNVLAGACSRWNEAALDVTGR